MATTSARSSVRLAARKRRNERVERSAQWMSSIHSSTGRSAPRRRDQLEEGVEEAALGLAALGLRLARRLAELRDQPRELGAGRRRGARRAPGRRRAAAGAARRPAARRAARRRRARCRRRRGRDASAASAASISSPSSRVLPTPDSPARKTSDGLPAGGLAERPLELGELVAAADEAGAADALSHARQVWHRARQAAARRAPRLRSAPVEPRRRLRHRHRNRGRQDGGRRGDRPHRGRRAGARWPCSSPPSAASTSSTAPSPTTSCCAARPARAQTDDEIAPVPLRAAGLAAPRRRARRRADRPRAAARARPGGGRGAADYLVVEGVGGFLVPLTADYLVRDLARDLGLPVVIAASPGPGDDQPHAADDRGGPRGRARGRARSC